MVLDKQCLEDSEQMVDSFNEEMRNKGVYRTALATPSLLKIPAMKRKYPDKKRLPEESNCVQLQVNYI